MLDSMAHGEVPKVSRRLRVLLCVLFVGGLLLQTVAWQLLAQNKQPDPDAGLDSETLLLLRKPSTHQKLPKVAVFAAPPVNLPSKLFHETQVLYLYIDIIRQFAELISSDQYLCIT